MGKYCSPNSFFLALKRNPSAVESLSFAADSDAVGDVPAKKRKRGTGG
jgi:hypothetical protein